MEKQEIALLSNAEFTKTAEEMKKSYQTLLENKIKLIQLQNKKGALSKDENSQDKLTKIETEIINLKEVIATAESKIKDDATTSYKAVKAAWVIEKKAIDEQYKADLAALSAKYQEKVASIDKKNKEELFKAKLQFGHETGEIINARHNKYLQYYCLVNTILNFKLPVLDALKLKLERMEYRAALSKHKYLDIFEEDKEVNETSLAKANLAKCESLRKDSIYAVSDLEEEIASLKNNKQIDDNTKVTIIANDKDRIKEAKARKVFQRHELRYFIAEAATFIKIDDNSRYVLKKREVKATLAKENNDYKELSKKIEEEHLQNVTQINAGHQPEIVGAGEDKVALKKAQDSLKDELRDEKFSYKSKVQDAKRAHMEVIAKNKDELHSIYLEKFNYLTNLRGGKVSYFENTEYKFKEYAYKFNAAKFFTNNALYIIISLALIVGIILSGFNSTYTSWSTDYWILTWPNIWSLLEQCSSRIFFALGVAGLILLAGTDLSIGRMLGMGSVVTAMILHPGDNVIQVFGLAKMNFDSWPMASRIILAILISVVLCTIFSSIAGFFSAKFKMHPFISTLSTQLIIYGLMMVATKGVNSGTIDNSIKASTDGSLTFGGTLSNAGFLTGFPILFVYTLIAILIISFIWNKTKFGKNMYAVGGNAEAASVSGISVFWTTLGVFILAGICYGFGSFFETVRSGVGSANTGFGWELDAIAACVVGGISFNGGIGKIKGAVIGVFIFQGLTYVLSYIGVDVNTQFIIKGIILLTAVTLDCIKYIKKK
jgi:methyl-galactoside transport system permease protein